MKTRLANLWEKVHTSYWFVPTLMVGVAIALAFGLMWLDTAVLKGEILTDYPAFDILYSGGMEGARELLSTIAASVITIAGVAFSIIIVALSLASRQFGPLVLRNYMRSTTSQLVMGTFVSTFIYCLLILRAIEDTPEHGLRFHISITVAVALALASIYAFIYFIHNAAVSIQAESVVRAAYLELQHAIHRLHPQELGKAPDPQDRDAAEDQVLKDYNDRGRVEIAARKAGYVQAVDNEGLMRLARKHGLVFRLHYRPGDYLMPQTPMIRCYCRREPAEELKKKIAQTFLIGTKRTPEQDAEFTINQMVQITLRALSPSLNDPFTAMTCIDHLGAGLLSLARRAFPSRYRFDRDGRLCIIAGVPTYAGFVHSAFYQIGYNCGRQRAVRRHLISTLESIVAQVESESRRMVLERMIAGLHDPEQSS